MLRSITEVFGADMWFSTVLLLTHGGAPPPDTSAGQPMALEMFYQQRGQQAQNMLRQVAGDQRCAEGSLRFAGWRAGMLPSWPS